MIVKERNYWQGVLKDKIREKHPFPYAVRTLFLTEFIQIKESHF